MAQKPPSSSLLNLAVAVVIAYISVTLLWTVILWIGTDNIDWESRTISATCYDPEGDFWGSPAYKGTWVLCDQSGDGTCTPWGSTCWGNKDLTYLCPLDFGGIGNGCYKPSIMTTVTDMYFHSGMVQNPMWAFQAHLQNMLVFAVAPALAIMIWCSWKHKKGLNLEGQANGHFLKKDHIHGDGFFHESKGNRSHE
uniref:Uncharacterized protein n=1 Tax=Trieres chinensis TaxID=1514140 RepID=A0A7S2EEM3_TRICV